MRALVLALLLLLATTAAAQQEVPVGLGVTFGPGRAPLGDGCFVPAGSDGFVVSCPVPIPAGATKITGWSGFTIIRTAAVLYVSIKPWHRRTVLHKLTDFIAHRRPGTCVPVPNSAECHQYDQMGPFGYTFGGHDARPGDEVWFDAYCPGGVNAYCSAEFTFHFLVP
jgi:hypothetical protein